MKTFGRGDGDGEFLGRRLLWTAPVSMALQSDRHSRWLDEVRFIPPAAVESVALRADGFEVTFGTAADVSYILEAGVTVTGPWNRVASPVVGDGLLGTIVDLAPRIVFIA